MASTLKDKNHKSFTKFVSFETRIERWHFCKFRSEYNTPEEKSSQCFGERSTCNFREKFSFFDMEKPCREGKITMLVSQSYPTRELRISVGTFETGDRIYGAFCGTITQIDAIFLLKMHLAWVGNIVESLFSRRVISDVILEENAYARCRYRLRHR